MQPSALAAAWQRRKWLGRISGIAAAAKRQGAAAKMKYLAA